MAKSKRSKATDISQKVKQIVWERDGHRCIICRSTKAMPNAHYIKRSQGGLGIPQNVVTLCLNCHYEEDFGQNSEWYEKQIEEYLKNYYGEKWRKEDLVYNKWMGI